MAGREVRPEKHILMSSHNLARSLRRAEHGSTRLRDSTKQVTVTHAHEMGKQRQILRYVEVCVSYVLAFRYLQKYPSNQSTWHSHDWLLWTRTCLFIQLWPASLQRQSKEDRVPKPLSLCVSPFLLWPC